MPFYSAPGVYVEEVPGGARPIQPIGMGTAGFVGLSPKHDAFLNEVRAINNWSEFLRAYVADDSESTPLAQAVFGFFENRGQRCFVCNIGTNKSIAGDARTRSGLSGFEANDEIRIVAAPGFCDPVSHDALLSHCEKMQDRFGILDCPQDVDDISRLTKVAEVSSPRREEGEPKPRAAGPAGGLAPRQSDLGYGAFYFPWIETRDPLSGKIVSVPPSGHIAGVYARSDAMRGVHKAPANETISGAVGLRYQLTQEENGLLNSSRVNCIRSFSSQGIRIWGARTVADPASNSRYVNVRRTLIRIRESIQRGTNWITFEPNEPTLWMAICRDIRNFLMLLWNEGALVGATPEQADRKSVV